MNIRQKLILGAIIIVVVPSLIISVALGYLGYTSERATIIHEEQSKLVSIRDARKDELELYMENLERQIKAFSRSQIAVDATRRLTSAFNGYSIDSQLDMNIVKSEVSQYYSKDFADEFAARNADEAARVDDKFSGLSDTALALQYHYIANNPFPLGKKEGLDRAEDGSLYSQLHSRYHDEFRAYLNTFEFYDMFLVDSKNGNIVYSVFKELDFGTSLIDGPYAKTGIGRVFVKANTEARADAVVFEDFSTYLPSYNDQAVFIASPVFDGKQRIGVFIIQIPIDVLNDIMTADNEWKSHGLGDSGETYLVGPDGLLRNESRFFIDDRENYFNTLEVANIDASEIKKRGTTIGLQTVNSTTALAALRGESGFSIVNDYRNIPVLSAYTSVDILGTRWAVMAEIDEAEAFAAAIELRTRTILLALAITLVVSGVVVFFVLRLIQTITKPIGVLDETVRQVMSGDIEARTGLDSVDELGTLGRSFDTLLDERITAGQKAELENEKLNNSVVNLIRAVSEISKRDFTIQIPVSEDVTGAVSDALNLLTSEMSAALNTMKNISTDVSQVSTDVKKQSDNVLVLAKKGLISVDDTASTLNTAADEMRKIATEAQDISDYASSATEVTASAMDTVNKSATSINKIRDTVSETEKRIKRLGERSQEISGIVNIINSIAERTHILALNASMHAASAGEAGRGFAVVADEVQRLAENAREATAEIGTLVNNIRVETTDAASVMNTAITQVAEGTRLAEEAGQSMADAQHTTSQLVESVMSISGNAIAQADVADVIKQKAVEMQNSSRKTAAHINNQKKNTDTLVQFSEKLMDQVSVFKLSKSA